MRDFLSVAECAAALGVSARTVERMLQDGRLSSRRIGAARVIAPTTLADVQSRRAATRAPNGIER